MQWDWKKLVVFAAAAVLIVYAAGLIGRKG